MISSSAWGFRIYILHDLLGALDVAIASDEQEGWLNERQLVLDRQIEVAGQERQQRVLPAELMRAGVLVIQRILACRAIRPAQRQPPQQGPRREQRIGKHAERGALRCAHHRQPAVGSAACLPRALVKPAPAARSSVRRTPRAPHSPRAHARSRCWLLHDVAQEAASAR